MSSSGINLKSKLLHGSAWMMGSQWVHRVLGMISTVITARLLMPQDFGIVAILYSVVAAIDSFMDFGFDLALIKDKSATQNDYNAAWSMRVLRSIVFSILILVFSPLISLYSDTPEIIAIAYVVSASIFIRGFHNIGTVDFHKNLQFDLVFKLRFYPKLLGVIITIILAVLLRNYWALVFGTLFSSLLQVVLSFYLSKYRPKFIWAGYSKIWSYSKWVLLLNFSRQNFRNLDKMVLSGFIGKDALGFYSVSDNLSSMLTTEWIEPVVTVLRPGYANLQDDINELGRVFLLSLSIFAAALIPSAAGVWLLSSDIVSVMLGSQWQDAVVFVGIFGWLAILGSFSNFLTSFMSMTGMVKTASNVVTCRVVLFFAFFYFVFMGYGLIGIIYFKMILLFTELVVLMIPICKYLKFSVYNIFLILWRPVLSSLCMAAILLLIAEKIYLHVLLNLFIQAGTGAGVYIICSLCLWIISKKPNGIEQQVLDIILPRLSAFTK